GELELHPAQHPGVSVVDAVDRGSSDVAVLARPHLRGCFEREDSVVQERLPVDRGHSLTAPSVTLMIWRWKMKNKIATGIVMIRAAASFNGYCVPCPS